MITSRLLLLLACFFHLAFGLEALARPEIRHVYFLPEQLLEPAPADELRMIATQQGREVTWPDSKAIYSPLMTPSAAEGRAAAPKSEHFGTYLIELSGDQPGKKGISFNINESYRMFLIRGNEISLLHEDGRVSADATQNFYRLVPFGSHEAYFSYESGGLWLLVQTSAPAYKLDNRVYSSLGIVSMKFDEAERLRTRVQSGQIYQVACTGALILVFVYQLAIFLLRREDLSNLMLAFAALVFIMRCVAEEQILALYFEQSDSLATFNSAIQFLRFIFLNCMSFLVSYFLIKPVYTRKYIITLFVMFVITVLTIGSVHLNPVFPGHVKDKALALLTLVLLLSSLLAAWLFVKAWRQRIPGAAFGLFGYVAGPILIGLDAMIILGKIDMFRVGTLGLLAMTFSSSLIIGRQFAEAYRQAGILNSQLTEKNREIQDMNHNLEVKVEHRTRELKTIFDNIPQGVASLNGKGIISQNYSKHLETILKRKELGGRSIMEFFTGTTLSQDAMDRMMASLEASIGEDQLSFTLNSGNFPLEVRVNRESGSSFYALTWGPELTSDGVVASVLMTIEDVTDKKRLEVESEKQRQDLLIIQELVQCEPNKFDIFTRASEALLAENLRLIQAGAISPDDIKIMFVNAHTVKGGARTLGLSGLANTLHEIEHEYAQITKGQMEPQQESLAVNIDRAWAQFNLYITINRDKLGRKMNGNQVAVDIQFIKSHYRTLASMMSESQSSPAALLDNIRVIKDQLASFIFKSDTHILEECLEPAAKIAKDLGKPAPVIKLATSEIQVPRESEQVLRNAMIHILRNALDHGIEPAQERQGKGKDQTGLIEVRTRVDNDMIVIEFHDDGRGLAIQKLKEKAVKAGCLREPVRIESIAETIFLPGLSTAETLSQISGRGVGMDAVKKFISNGGGTIGIRLLKDEGDYIPFTLEIKLPLKVA
ncbi:ATP-binding protein [Oligoflexus tunisiensis]|uniref:ATP-binding protein n=1 Tax=Oligoflexus tunisiensis TaxID=708132 RepID=UPI000A92A3E6|nr:ATP-binding protein [Oligoflexus tunisiensis]